MARFWEVAELAQLALLSVMYVEVMMICVAATLKVMPAGGAIGFTAAEI